MQIKFSCPLTETVTRQLNFTNPTVHSVGFLLLFFDNDNEFFTIVSSQPIINLNGHGTAIIKIEFHAKKIKETKGNYFFLQHEIEFD